MMTTPLKSSKMKDPSESACASPFLKEGQEKDINSHFYADPESQHGRRVAKKRARKRQQPDNWCFYADPESQHDRRVAKKKDKKKTTRVFTLIRKVNTVDGSPKKKDKKKTNRAFMLIWRVNTVDGSPKKRTRKRQLTLLHSLIGPGNLDCPSSKSRSGKRPFSEVLEDLRTFLPTRKMSVSCALIRDQQTNSENKKSNSRKRLLDCYLWFPAYIHEVLNVRRTYLY